ncbi:hypothetical protein DEU56DRAFT_919998 [Suillus clintonianus]|uniref:uncharacterized protein n=1 Tax=Suillus clintonianus TaxID=1904413 RepID=UPI001B86DAB7|nr:uncharacterized protein DEU56DRAFT_919998 [Suillus clintonianus]KAG2111465.1 hypothetical protein DEU56DRAFT_919998 [Suillus clintonianus]
MPGIIESQSITLEFIDGHNLQVPSKRMPAGIYISINVDSRRRWNSAIRVLSSDKSVAWGDSVTPSSHESPALLMEIRASFEQDRTLGNDESFELSFPPVHGVNPSFMLKATVVHACDNQDGALFDSPVDCEIAQDTDAGHARYAEYRTRQTVSHLNDALEHFQLVLDGCPVDHPDHAAALTNLTRARLQGYVQNDLQDIDTTTSLLHEALALRPQGHPDHILSLYNIITSLNWRYSKEPAAAYLHESLQLIGVDVISGRNNPTNDASDEGIHLQRVVLKLCPPGHQRRPIALTTLVLALNARFRERGSIADLEESIEILWRSDSLSGYMNCLVS